MAYKDAVWLNTHGINYTFDNPNTEQYNEHSNIHIAQAYNYRTIDTELNQELETKTVYLRSYDEFMRLINAWNNISLNQGYRFIYFTNERGV